MLLIGSFVVVILRAFGVTKNLKTINTEFSVIVSLLFLATIISTLSGGFIADSTINVGGKIYVLTRDFFALFVALLIPCVWHQVEAKE